MSNLHPAVARVTDRIIARSKPGRAAYLDALEERVLQAAAKPVDRSLKIENPLHLVPDGAWRQQR